MVLLCHRTSYKLAGRTAMRKAAKGVGTRRRRHRQHTDQQSRRRKCTSAHAYGRPLPGGKRSKGEPIESRFLRFLLHFPKSFIKSPSNLAFFPPFLGMATAARNLLRRETSASPSQMDELKVASGRQVTPKGGQKNGLGNGEKSIKRFRLFY